LTFLLNRDHWAFDDAEPRYTSVLFSAEKARSDPSRVTIHGPFTSLARFQEGVQREPVRFAVDDVLSWTDTAALPLLPDEESLEVFVQLRRAPRLDLNDGKSWRARPFRELETTPDAHLMDLRSKECPQGYWRVYKGESFDIWSPDTGKYYAWANPEKVLGHLQDKRRRAARNKRSPFSEFGADWRADPKTLPCLRPRIAFRDVSRATDTRTVRVALVPPQVFSSEEAATLLWPRGDEKDQAYLLGMLSSIPLDWYSRRFVEGHVRFHVLNASPIPRSGREGRGWERVVTVAGRLAAVDDRFGEWAEEVGVECGPLDDGEKEDMIAELDAVVAHLYGLTEPQLVHIFETFHEGWDCSQRLEAVLEHYRDWQRRL
jgi:hypothetical protein